MTVADVVAALSAISAYASDGDPEAAHSAEDVMRAQVLLAIAAGAPNARELAAAAVKSADIAFPRWCA